MRKPTYRIEDLSDEELVEMQQHIGRMVANLPIASKLAGHSRPALTIDYLRVGENDSRSLTVAKEYLFDILKARSNDAVLTKWFSKDIERMATERAFARWG